MYSIHDVTKNKKSIYTHIKYDTILILNMTNL